MTDDRVEERTHRTGLEVEIDVLMAMATVGPFRLRARQTLHVEDFSTAQHRDLYRMLCRVQPPPTEVDEWVGRVLGVPVQDALKLRMDASPATYDGDVRWLLSQR